MAVIREEDIVHSVAEALQFISYYHPADYVRHLGAAYEREESPAAREAIGQILANSRMAALGHRPMCQDTGTVNAFVRVGLGARIETTRNLEALVDEGVRRAYLDSANPLRASIITDPLFSRRNTRDNAPAVTHTSVVPGEGVTITLMAKGGGSENKSRFAMLNPSDDLVEWVVETVRTLGAGWCPPGMIGLGVGGSAEKAMLMAKEALFEPIDMDELLARGPRDAEEEIRIELYRKINALGVGAQGLGGLTTVVDVKLRTFPTHAASKPVGLIPQCAANRHVTFTLDGTGPATLTPPALSDWPQVTLDRSAHAARRVDLDRLTREEVAAWLPGETLLLNGRMLTGRDAAHKRLADMIARQEPLPVDLRGRAIYYVGPVDPVAGEVIGPAGPTTATRMDKFTETILAETGLFAMIGKAERGPAAIAAIARHKAAYLIAIGGAAILVSRAIRAARVVAFADLGMEAIYEFTVEDMPVTVAVDAQGRSLHQLGPAEWRRRIAERPSAVP
jgi:fumarate hydratase class I